MKKTYNIPEYELLILEDEDIITTSPSVDIDVPGEDLDLPLV